MRQAKLCVGRRQAVVYADLYVLFAMTPIDFRQGSVGALLLLLPPTNQQFDSIVYVIIAFGQQYV